MTQIYPTRPKRRRINVSLSDAAWRRLTLYTAMRNLDLPYQLTRSAVIEDCINHLPDTEETDPRADDARATLDAAAAARKERHR